MTSNVNGVFDVAVTRQQLETFCRMDQERGELMNNTLKQLIDRDNLIRAMELELDDQKTSRIHYQKENALLKNRLASVENRIERNSFAVALIDGDGAIFQDEILRNLDTGGDVAGQRISEAIRRYLSDINPDFFNNNALTIVRIYANLGDLGIALFRNGLIPTKDHITRFVEDFNIHHPEFDIVNVGKGKENADSKIRRMFEFYYNNIQCKHIIFAGCHDNGYLHDLRQKRGGDGGEQRIILLETTPAEPGFHKLGFPVTRFESVFRSTPLDNKGKQAVAAPQSPLASTRETRSSDVTSPSSGGKEVSELKDWRRSPNGGLSINYANVGGSAKHENIAISSTGNQESLCIRLNSRQHRLDPPIKRWSQTAQMSYNNKVASVRPRGFCNDFYLLGKCPNISSCEREHDKNHKLIGEELFIQRYRARSSPCLAGPTCQNFRCLFGHHCPHGLSCVKEDECKFKHTMNGDMHPQSADDLVPVLKLVEGQPFPQHIN